MTPPSRLANMGRRAAVVVLATGLLTGAALGAAESASAHDYLVSTNPAADSTVTEPLTTVSLTFNEPPLADASAAIAIELHDPSGANVASGSVSIVNSTLSIDVAPTAQGAYTVLWQNVSADGHTVSGEFGFQYAGPAAAGDAGGGDEGGTAVSTPGAGASGEGGASATPDPAVTPTVTGSGPGTAAAGGDASPGAGGVQLPLVLVGIGSAIGVVVIVAVVLLVVARHRSRSGA